MLCDGNSCERQHIERWFEEGDGSSPVTGASLPSQSTVPNHALRNAIKGTPAYQNRAPLNHMPPPPEWLPHDMPPLS